MRGLLNLKGKGDFYLNIVMYRLSSILKINISESIFFYIAQPLSWTTCKCSSGMANETSEESGMPSVQPTPFCSHTCCYISVCATSPICPMSRPRQNLNLALSPSSHRGNSFRESLPSNSSPIKCLNAWLVATSPRCYWRLCAQATNGQPGVWLWPAVSPKGCTDVTCSKQRWETRNMSDTHSAAVKPRPLRRLGLEGLDSQQRGILEWTESEMLQWLINYLISFHCFKRKL